MTRHQILRDAGRRIVRAAPQLYIDLDVESDGPAGIGSLLSVGAVDPWGNTFYRELRPTDKPGTAGSRKFCEEHGLQRERLLREGMDPYQAMRELSVWVGDRTTEHGKSKAVLVAFPSWFDFGLVNTTAIEAGLTNPFKLDGHCIQSLAMTLGLGGADPTYDWDNASRLNLPPDVLPDLPFTHHALEDAQYQQAMHFALVGLVRERLSP